MATWTDATAVADWMGLPSLATDPVLAQCVEAVQRYQETHFDPDALTVAVHRADPDLLIATAIRSAALYKRRQTPDGISSVGDFAAMRVLDSDPDVARYEVRLWAFGFA